MSKPDYSRELSKLMGSCVLAGGGHITPEEKHQAHKNFIKFMDKLLQDCIKEGFQAGRTNHPGTYLFKYDSAKQFLKEKL